MVKLQYDVLCRVQSRVCIVPFKGPSTAPTTEAEQDSYDELDTLILDGTMSAAIGWVIRVGSLLQDRSEIRDMTRRFRPYYSGRKAINWALLGICVKQVLLTICVFVCLSILALLNCDLNFTIYLHF